MVSSFWRYTGLASNCDFMILKDSSIRHKLWYVWYTSESDIWISDVTKEGVKFSVSMGKILL